MLYDNNKLCSKCIHNTKNDVCYNQNEIADFEKWIDECGCQEFDDKGNYQKIIHAKWVNIRRYYDSYTDEDNQLMNCSNCEETIEIGEFSEPYLYCPTCGAKMDEE